MLSEQQETLLITKKSDQEPSQDFIFRSKLPDMVIPNHLPLTDYVFQRFSGNGDGDSTATCLIDSATGRIFTYADVQISSRRVAAGIHRLGIRQRDTVMLLLPNSPEFALCFLAVAYLGAATTTANPLFTQAEITKLAKASSARMIITKQCYVEKLTNLQNVLIVCLDEGDDTVLDDGCVSFTQLTQADETKLPKPEISPEDTVAIPYSSGTTGLPKGVMITHKGLVTSIAQKVDGENPNLNFTGDDVIICFLPMFHTYAFNALILPAMRTGAAILIVQRFELNMVMELIQRYKVTVAPVAPPVVLAFVKSPETERYDLSSVRMMISGAATLRKELEEAVRLKFPSAVFGQVYGMTESGTVAKSLSFAKNPFKTKSGACGTVIRNAEMKVVDTVTGVSLPYNKSGEICIRGDQLMKGYLNDLEATARTIDEDGWLHTGDIGFVDDDDEIFIVDRLKELIKFKGYQVAPAEIEALLISHPYIEDAAVVAMKDEVGDEVPVAFVVRLEGSQLTEDDVKSYVRKQFSGDRDSTATCLIDGATGRKFTYGDVQIGLRRIAAGIHRLGIRQRDTVMLLLPNSPEFALCFLAVAYLGAVSTTANPFYTESEIEKQAKASATKMIITKSCYVDKLKNLQNDGVLIVCVDNGNDAVPLPEGCVSFKELTQADETELPKPEISPEDTVAMPYSSGTTGLPKGVMITHKGLVTSIAQKVDGENPNVSFTGDDVILCFLPMFHIYALDALMLSAMRTGAAILIVPRFELNLVMELIQRYKVTVVPVAPPVVLAFVKSQETERYDLSSVRMMLSGAATLKKELEDAVRLKFPNAIFGQGYGMTESGTVAKSLAFAKNPFKTKSGACGTVIRNAEMKVVDTITGVSLPRNKPGELCIRGDQLMKGYLNDPEATAITIDKNGWLHTGDIGFVDDDDEVFIVDRLKELIKFKGYQVAPAELEALLISHPYIEDAAVVAMKDEIADEVPVAYVVRSEGSQLTEDDVKSYVNKQVVHYKRIKMVFFIEAIPKAVSGKILRKELRAKLEVEYTK
ncbi:unnamed protein product [Eruca vesicaria subsp. sativa]|uniref:4-coumarate--CoA ligase n=1 Tax=Eruca vesicaria subsp. sativa TaxID=29727 RepID=A0ABC8LI63_ERUVS|nr:unnamed protein product [Eruca vesicaria subsp. sativa]